MLLNASNDMEEPFAELSFGELFGIQSIMRPMKAAMCLQGR
jgi:hypothetical protein